MSRQPSAGYIQVLALVYLSFLHSFAPFGSFADGLIRELVWVFFCFLLYSLPVGDRSLRLLSISMPVMTGSSPAKRGCYGFSAVVMGAKSKRNPTCRVGGYSVCLVVYISLVVIVRIGIV